MTKDLTNKTIKLLESGKHPEIKKYAGKHVMVVEDEIVPLRGTKKDVDELLRLEKDHGQKPILTFIPKPGVTYIFSSWLS